MFADQKGTDFLGNECYGNMDGKVTLNELYKYSKEPIHQYYVNERRRQEMDPRYNKRTYLIVTYPQVYPSNDDYVIYRR